MKIYMKKGISLFIALVMVVSLLNNFPQVAKAAASTGWTEITGSASFGYVTGIAVDGSGSVYVTDANNNNLQKLSGGTWADITANPAIPETIGTTIGVTTDDAGNVYMTDTDNAKIWELTNGAWTDITNDTNNSSPITNPAGIAVAQDGTLYVTDQDNSKVWKRATGGTWTDITNVAFDNMSGPFGIAVDAVGNLYVTDSYKNKIWKMSTGGAWTDITGTETFDSPMGIAVDSCGNVLVADYNSRKIKELPNGGTAWLDITGGQSFANPIGVAVDSLGNVYVADTGEGAQYQKIFKGTGLYYTNVYSIDTEVNLAAGLRYPQGIAFDSSRNMYITDNGNQNIVKVDANTKAVSTLVSANSITTLFGNGSQEALDYYPTGVAVDNQGNIYIADAGNNIILKADSTGQNISVYAGSLTSTGNTAWDGGLATSVDLGAPYDVACDSSGNLYVSDNDSGAIIKVDASTQSVSVVNTSGATIDSPRGIAIDGSGNIYVTSSRNVLKVDATGVCSIVAGNGFAGSTGDGGSATAAALNDTSDIAVDGRGNLYIMDIGNSDIRVVDAATDNIYTIAGITNNCGYSGDGGPALSAAISPSSYCGIAVDSDGNVYFSNNNYFDGVSVQSAYVVRKLVPVQHTLTYNSNGAIGTVPEDNNYYSQNTAATILGNTNGMTKTGYTFAGWNTKADGTGTDYAAGDSMTMLMSNVTLYAMWEVPSSGGGGLSSGGASSNSEDITVDVKEGDTDNTASKITVRRTTNSDGQKTDTVNYATDKAKETIQQLKDEGKDTARIVIPDPNDVVSETKVTIPADSIDTLADGKVNLQIDTEEAKISLSKATLEGISTASEDDLYFRVVPVKDAAQKDTAVNHAMQLAVQVSGNADSSASIIGNPVTIETNMSSSAADITIPLNGVTIPTDPAERAAFLEQLGVYIEHSDGDKELVQGELVEYKPGVYGIKFHITKFSTFTAVRTDAFTKIKVAKGFAPLRLRAKATSTSQNLTYTKVSNADGYILYGAPCGTENKLVKITSLSAKASSYKVTGLEQDTYYKYQVKAYKVINGKKVIIAVSKVVHSTTTSKKYANATKVTVKTATVSLRAGKSKTLVCGIVLPSGKRSAEHINEITFETTNKAIATVNSDGKITAKAKGTCYIYAYAQNGVYKKIKVTVK